LIVQACCITSRNVFSRQQVAPLLKMPLIQPDSRALTVLASGNPGNRFISALEEKWICHALMSGLVSGAIVGLAGRARVSVEVRETLINSDIPSLRA
jgi:hypothetical protein